MFLVKSKTEKAKVDPDSFVKNSIEYFQLTIPTRLAFRKTGKDAIRNFAMGQR